LETFGQFLKRLEALEWKDVGQFDPDVLTVLAEVGRQPGLVHDAVNSWSAKGLEKRQLSCHDTATHYKWFLHFHEKQRFKVWLHQYKSASERRLGHAEVPHNHRYSLASVILSGGFVHHYFDRTGGVLKESESARHSYRAGDAYTIGWEEVHKLSDIDDRTFTLVVESRPVRHFSEAYYAASAEPVIFRDFVELHPQLAAEMRLIADAGRSIPSDIGLDPPREFWQ